MKPAFTVHSPETQTEYVIYVVAPKVPQRGRQGVPAVLFMDGDNQFSYAVKAYRKARAAKKVRPLLLVGVGYGASCGKPENKRGRDYTPTAHHYEPTSGGADAFLKFLQRTLWPELKRRYAVNDTLRGIAGHSLGSLLVLHALFRQPEFFTHYLASAPSIWWDNRSILRIAARRRSKNARLPARLFLCVGGKDSTSMLDDLERFELQLAHKPFRQLELTSLQFPRRTHYNVLPDAFGEGLQILFPAK